MKVSDLRMTREQFVEQVKMCGQSVIDNAEKIYNDFQYSTNGVQIMIEIDKMKVPEITVINKFIPENYIKFLGVNDQTRIK